jgi:hypothetical protein
MDERPVRLYAYVYPDADGNGDFGHLFDKDLNMKLPRRSSRDRAWA